MRLVSSTSKKDNDTQDNEKSRHYQAIRIFFFEEATLRKPEVSSLFVEDRINEENYFSNFLDDTYRDKETNGLVKDE